MLCVIGECLEYSDDINGAVVSIRPRTVRICKNLVGYALISPLIFLCVFISAIWTADSTNQDAIIGIGLILKEYLQLPSDIEMFYAKHEDTASKLTNKPLPIPVKN